MAAKPKTLLFNRYNSKFIEIRGAKLSFLADEIFHYIKGSLGLQCSHTGFEPPYPSGLYVSLSPLSCIFVVSSGF